MATLKETYRSDEHSLVTNGLEEKVSNNFIQIIDCWLFGIEYLYREISSIDAKMLQVKKYPENFSASTVADVTIKWGSDLNLTSYLSNPKRTSVWIVLSQASTMMTEH